MPPGLSPDPSPCADWGQQQQQQLYQPSPVSSLHFQKNVLHDVKKRFTSQNRFVHLNFILCNFPDRFPLRQPAGEFCAAGKPSRLWQQRLFSLAQHLAQVVTTKLICTSESSCFLKMFCRLTLFCQFANRGSHEDHVVRAPQPLVTQSVAALAKGIGTYKISNHKNTYNCNL